MTQPAIRYTNNKKIPLALAVFLATDHYDHDPNTLSATAIIKPVRQTILKGRVPPEKQLIDLDTLIQSRLGTSIHDGIERAWLGDWPQAMRELGYPDDIIEMIIVNPDPETVRGTNKIPIYMEQRHYRDITVMGKTFSISGKMDFVAEGAVQDFKSTIAYTYKHGTKMEDFALQGSIYRWLAPHIITEDHIHIHYIFMDWAAFKLHSEKNYPPARCHSVKVPLLSLQETEAYITNKLSQVINQQSMPETEITFCTDKELWRDDDVWKYYKNADNCGVKGKRSTANFDKDNGGGAAAQARFEKDNSVGKILFIPGKVKACKYCAGFYACTQKDLYLKDGSLTFEDDLAA